MYNTSDIRNGLKIELDGAPYTVTYFQFVKPGKGTAFTRTKLKNLLSGAVIERTFRTGEKLEPAQISEATMQYLYNDGEAFNFMNSETFEQVAIPESVIGSDAQFLLEQMEVRVLFYKNNPVNIELPNFVELEVTYTEPAVKGNTSQGATKTAKMNTGAEVQVPLFIEQGELLKVDTRTGEYVERVKK
ncbi:MAG: elongation factor P [Alphaproteobacteria bacterium]|nr:elongation factor P [Alphaproteobacteria bacterium]